MMRVIAAVAAAVLIAALAWLAGRSYSKDASRPQAATASPTAAETPTPLTPLPSPSPPHHRLAGTVVGDARYAVIEDAEGGNELYRPGQIVPELGLLVEVGPHGAVFESDGKRFELQLTSAPTPTPKPTPVEEEEEITEPTPDSDSGSDSDRESDWSDSESSSSDEQDRPAS